MRGSLPSDQQFADGLELLRFGQSLGEDVGLLLFSTNVLGNDALVLANLTSEEVVLQGQILVARGHLGNIDERKASLVVLKDCGPNRALLDKIELQL